MTLRTTRVVFLRVPSQRAPAFLKVKHKKEKRRDTIKSVRYCFCLCLAGRSELFRVEALFVDVITLPKRRNNDVTNASRAHIQNFFVSDHKVRVMTGA